MVALVTLLGIVVVHLVFLGAFSMVGHCRTHAAQGQFDDGQPETAIKWRDDPHLLPADETRWITNIVHPGSDHPHGPIQQFVAEIFDSDEPPFFKNFLSITTSDQLLHIEPVLVTGGPAPNADTEPQRVDIPLTA